MDKKLLNRIPKKYHAAIKDVYRDEDGYWCIIGCNSGWKLEGYFSDYTVHEDTVHDIVTVIRQSLKKQ